MLREYMYLYNKTQRIHRRRRTARRTGNTTSRCHCITGGGRHAAASDEALKMPLGVLPFLAAQVPLTCSEHSQFHHLSTKFSRQNLCSDIMRSRSLRCKPRCSRSRRPGRHWPCRWHPPRRRDRSSASTMKREHRERFRTTPRASWPESKTN